MINPGSKYFIKKTVWPGSGAISACILEIASDGKKTLHISDDKQTIQTYEEHAKRVSDKELDALWGVLQ